ncbi:MAG: hypothetical protein HWN65_21090 [Candidatus Helarchaeota archaeon]|nr:hypothetical protein [Candidatus Helarchaeota archaeon]
MFPLGTLYLFANCLPDKFRIGSKPFIFMIVDVLLNALNAIKTDLYNELEEKRGMIYNS